MTTEVVILTKAPIPGRVKTRLTPAIGADDAAALHREMVWATLERVSQTNLPVRISLAEDENGQFADELHRAGYNTEPQAGGDLGDRIAHVLQRPGRQIVLGTDCVVFEPNWLYLAANSTDPVAIGPTEDGGYWSISVNGNKANLHPLLFGGIHWSTDTVFSTTISRLEQAKISFTLLPKAYDIDVLKDVERLRVDPECSPRLQTLLSSIFPT